MTLQHCYTNTQTAFLSFRLFGFTDCRTGASLQLKYFLYFEILSAEFVFKCKDLSQY